MMGDIIGSLIFIGFLIWFFLSWLDMDKKYYSQADIPPKIVVEFEIDPNIPLKDHYKGSQFEGMTPSEIEAVIQSWIETE